MTKTYLPTELGVEGEGSHSGIDDDNAPDVKTVKAGEPVGVSTQPSIYKKDKKAAAPAKKTETVPGK